MSLCMIEAIASLGCRLFANIVSQLDLEDKVSHYPIGDDLSMSMYVC